MEGQRRQIERKAFARLRRFQYRGEKHHGSLGTGGQVDISLAVCGQVLALAVLADEIDRVVGQRLASAEETKMLQGRASADKLERCSSRARAHRMVGAGTYANECLGVTP